MSKVTPLVMRLLGAVMHQGGPFARDIIHALGFIGQTALAITFTPSLSQVEKDDLYASLMRSAKEVLLIGENDGAILLSDIPAILADFGSEEIKHEFGVS